MAFKIQEKEKTHCGKMVRNISSSDTGIAHAPMVLFLVLFMIL